MHNRILCSSGVFTHETKLNDHSLILKYASTFECDGLEVIFYPAWYGRSRDIARDLVSHKITCPVVHGEKGVARLWGSDDAETRSEGIKRFEENLQFAAEIGAERMVLHLWERPEGDEKLDRNLEYYSTALDRAQELGVRLSAETIPTVVATPLANIRTIADRFPETEMTFDTEFLAFHDQVEEAFLVETLKSFPQLGHVHVKDYGGGLVSPEGVRYYLHPGEGQLDFRSLFSNLRACDYAGAITLESSGYVNGVLDVEKVNKSLEFLRSCIA